MTSQGSLSEERQSLVRGRRRAGAVALLRARTADLDLGGADADELAVGLRDDRAELGDLARGAVREP